MIVIAPDKFKGTLTAREATEAIASGLRDAGVADELLLCPMADGGDGSADVLRPLLPGDATVVESHEFVGPQCFAGIAAMQRSSYAFGMALRQAATTATTVYAAIGGTGCCDGGAGMLQALGMKARRADGTIIKERLTPYLLNEVHSVELPSAPKFVLLSDVRASLLPDCSEGLSALDFAPQKGFTPADMSQLQHALACWQRAVASPPTPVDGAGGGLGFALASALGAHVRAGAEFVFDNYRIPLEQASLIITGEGCIDRQTAAGKVVDTIVRRARAAAVPVLAIGGRVEGPHSFPTLALCAPGQPIAADPATSLRHATARHFASTK